MRSIVELEIDAPRARVAELFANPENTTRWMDDLEAYEPLAGPPGMPGSTYRLVPERGDPFVARVVSRNLPDDFSIELEAPGVTVEIRDELRDLPSGRTKLISREDFHFKGPLGWARSLLARRAIRGVHRRHMHAFKRYAEASAHAG